MFLGVGARPLVQFHFLNEQANPLWEGDGVCTGSRYRLQSKLHIHLINYT